MIYIQKKNEPRSLTQYKKQKYAYFDGCNKEDIRENLLNEQGSLCAYCMRRINKKSMKIEHWYPEDRLSDRDKLEYKNMLGVCLGHIEGQGQKDDTCDTHKGNALITVNPHNKKTLKEIKYKSKSGEIYSDDAEIDKDLNKTLNLNSMGQRLPENRKIKLDSVISELTRKFSKGTWSTERLESFIEEYSKPDAEGKKKEYLGIIIWYINKKINRNP
ncbi:hypothetical protein [Mediterraneibacter gnavus]|uniref:hypothetical protein n=1 Tax=Mediterraneibacter gnavus TaxID=33038 RepID=UPI0034A0E8FC